MKKVRRTMSFPNLVNDIYSEKLAQWIADGLRRERHNEEFRGARVDILFNQNRDGDRTHNEIVVVLSNGLGFRMKVQDFKLSLLASVQTDRELVLENYDDSTETDEPETDESETDESEIVEPEADETGESEVA
jgi:hypothetical protein